MTELMANIESIMNSKGMRKATLASKIGKSRSTLNGWFNRNYDPKAIDLYSIASALDTTMEALVTGNTSTVIIDPNRKKLNTIIDKLPDTRILDLIRLAEGWLPIEEAGKLQA